MKKTTKCACGCNQTFIPSHGKKYATDSCKKAAYRRKKRIKAHKPRRYCIHCKKLIPQKQTLRRPVCLGPDCMTWWNEEEAPRRQAERNRVWSRTKRKAGGQKKPKGNTHKVKEAVKHRIPNEWNHEMYLAEQKEAKKPNGRLCGCGASLVGDEKFRCPVCLHRTDDWMSEAGDSGSMTRVFRSAAG